MPLSVIGAGFGRTGTMSLKLALEELGLGPCYHMTEVFAHPEHKDFWIRAASDAVVDWNEVFAGYGSTTDWPASNYYLQLAKFYPEAKVILTVRDAERWFDSTQETIFSFDDDEALDPKMMRFFGTVLGRSGIGAHRHDRAHCIAMYEKHNAEVRQRIPEARLLVFNVAEGWQPLCRFLGLAVPKAAFPRVNAAEDFHDKISDQMRGE